MSAQETFGSLNTEEDSNERTVSSGTSALALEYGLPTNRHLQRFTRT